MGYFKVISFNEIHVSQNSGKFFDHFDILTCVIVFLIYGVAFYLKVSKKPCFFALKPCFIILYCFVKWRVDIAFLWHFMRSCFSIFYRMLLLLISVYLRYLANIWLHHYKDMPTIWSFQKISCTWNLENDFISLV